MLNELPWLGNHGPTEMRGELGSPGHVSPERIGRNCIAVRQPLLQVQYVEPIILFPLSLVIGISERREFLELGLNPAVDPVPRQVGLPIRWGCRDRSRPP